MLQLYKTISPKLTFRKWYHFSLKLYNFNYSLNSDKFPLTLIKMNSVLKLMLFPFKKINIFIMKKNLFFVCMLVKKEKKTNSLRKYLKEVMLKNRFLSLSPP